MVVDVLNSYSLVVREESILLQGQPCVRGSDKTATDTTTLKGKYTESLTFSTPNCIYADYGKLGKPSLHLAVLSLITQV